MVPSVITGGDARCTELVLDALEMAVGNRKLTEDTHRRHH